MITFLTHYVPAFLLLLMPLVFVHEFGHFLFARLFAVRVEAFSIGFGWKLLKWKRGETEYSLSAIPLGGYVKLLGQDPQEEVPPSLQSFSYREKSKAQKFLILLGGPLFNLIFGFFVYTVLFRTGEPQIPAVLRRLEPHSLVEKSGFQVGDEIVKVNGDDVRSLEDLYRLTVDQHKRSDRYEFVVRRKGETDLRKLELDLLKESSKVEPKTTVLDELEQRVLKGASFHLRRPFVVNSNGQIFYLMELAGKPVNSFEEFEEIKKLWRGQVKTNEFPNLVKAKISTVSLDQLGSLETFNPSSESEPSSISAAEVLQWESAELVITKLVEGSPAFTAGLVPGDRLQSVNGVNLESFPQMRMLIQSFSEQGGALSLKVIRGHDLKTFSLKATPSEAEDLEGAKKIVYTVGVFPLFQVIEPDFIQVKESRLGPLIVKAWDRSTDVSLKILDSLKKLVSGQASVKSLGGPLMIGKLAGDSVSRGLASFLKVMALMSLSLGIFNLLPIPVLDGGHIAILGFEVLRRKDLTARQQMMFQNFGMTLVMALLVFVMVNDVSRLGGASFLKGLKK